ncbi:MAG: FHA domain-containing protein [Bradymonadaceae bacterium]
MSSDELDDPEGENAAVDRVAENLRPSNPESPRDEAGEDADWDELDEQEFESELRRALGGDESGSEESGESDDSTAGDDAESDVGTVEIDESQPDDSQVDGDTNEEGLGSPRQAPDQETSQAGFVEAVTGEVECDECGTTCPPGTQYCVHCGAELSTEEESSGEESDIRVPSPQQQPKAAEAIELVAVRDDGSEGQAIAIDRPEVTFGRNADKSFPTDEFLDPEHATFLLEDGELYVEDQRSLNGTFIQVRDEAELKPGDIFLAGRHVLKFEPIEVDFRSDRTSDAGTRYMGSPPPSGDYKLVQIGMGDVTQNVYHLPDADVVIGREQGDILFPHDQFMSSRHARITSGSAFYLVDLGSSNGTWIRMWDRTLLEDGDHVFMGQQLFRVDADTDS